MSNEEQSKKSIEMFTREILLSAAAIEEEERIEREKWNSRHTAEEIENARKIESSPVGDTEIFDEVDFVSEPLISRLTAIPPEKTHEYTEPKAEPPRKKSRRQTVIGAWSAGLSLIAMGVLLGMSLLTPAGGIFVLRFAPLMLIFLGAEILFGLIRSKRKTSVLRFDRAAWIIVGGVFVLSLLMSVISVAVGNNEEHRARLVVEFERRIAIEIEKEANAVAGISLKKVSVELILNDADLDGYFNKVKPTDYMNVNVEFSLMPSSPMVFAENVRVVEGLIAKRNIYPENVSFVYSDSFNNIRVSLNGRNETNLTAEQIAKRALYYAADFSYDDIPDLY